MSPKLFPVALIISAFIVHKSPVFGQKKEWVIQTDDTRIAIGTKDNSLMIFSLNSLQSKGNWTKIPSVLPLVNTVEWMGKKVATKWTFASADNKDNTVRLSFTNASPALELVSEWQARPGPGPVRHTMRISNYSSFPVTIFNQESIDIQVSALAALRTTYINDDASWPDSIGVYHVGFSNAFKKELKVSEVPDWIPFVILDENNARGIYVGWEWSIGRVEIEGNGKTGRIKMGVDDQFKTDIAPNETFNVPAAFIGAYTGDLDDAANRFRKYLFNHSMPDIITKDDSYPKVEWNAFAATGKKLGSWDPVESKYYPLIDDIAPMGFEEVMIDIGWWESYGDPENKITDHVDWPSGMAAAAKYAHDRNMRFGLYDNESEDLTSDRGKTERYNDIIFLLKDLHADIYRSDATAGPIAQGNFGTNQRAKYAEEVGYWSISGFYEVLDSLYRSVPGFSWENCSNGGGLKDFGALKRCAKIQNQDVYYPSLARKAFYDATFALHPMQLACVVGSWEPWQAKGSVYEFRSASMGAAYWHPDGPQGLNGGPVWNDKQKADITKAVKTYKEKLRPLIRHANLYHIFPRPDERSRDGIQYYDPTTGKGVVYIFQPTEDDKKPVKLKGLNPSTKYLLEFEDQSNSPVVLTGKVLMNNGIMVNLQGAEISELMFITLVK